MYTYYINIPDFTANIYNSGVLSSILERVTDKQYTKKEIVGEYGSIRNYDLYNANVVVMHNHMQVVCNLFLRLFL